MSTPISETNMPSAAESRLLSLEAKQAFVQHALPTMAEYSFSFICSVIGVVDETMGRHYGSGLRCVFDGRRAILTAHHVIDQACKEPCGLAISAGWGRSPYVVRGSVNIDPIADMAVYFLPDDYPCPESAFWPAERVDRSLRRLSTDYLFLHGFPGDGSYSSRLLGGVVGRSLPYGSMQRLENLPASLAAWQFAVEYDPAGLVSEIHAAPELVDPHGLSGSPVWRIGVSGRSPREWKAADSLLVGVLTRWAPAEKVLIATSTKKLPSRWLVQAME